MPAHVPQQGLLAATQARKGSSCGGERRRGTQEREREAGGQGAASERRRRRQRELGALQPAAAHHAQSCGYEAHGSGLSSRDDQAHAAFQLLCSPDLLAGHAQLLELGQVLQEGALQGQHSNGHGGWEEACRGREAQGRGGQQGEEARGKEGESQTGSPMVLA